MQTDLRRIAMSAFATLAVSLLPAATIVHAQTPQIERIDIFDVGIYCAETISKYPEPDAPGGYVNSVTEPKLLKRTSQIPMQVGTRFGMRYLIVGIPGEVVDIRLVTKLPPPGMQDPVAGKTILGGHYTYAARVGTTDFRGYHIEYDRERVPGIWTFEMWHNDRKLAEQNFTLADPQTALKNSTTCSPLMTAITPPRLHL